MTTYLKHSPLALFDTLEVMLDHKPDLDTLIDKAQLPLSAKDDYSYVYDFLLSYRGSPATFNSYRRELERLLHWSWLVIGRSLKKITRTDFESFVEFCQNPPIAWIGSKNVARFIDQGGSRVPNSNWRPFVVSVDKVSHSEGTEADPKKYTLSQKAIQAIFSVISSFYNYLIQESYVDSNPVAQIRQKSKFIRKNQGKVVIRRLSELQWGYVIETVEEMAADEPAVHERSLFIINALYGMYLRISELAASPRWQPQMGHFYCDNDGSWWFTTVGKGNKERIISVSNAMLAALRRYRKSLGLPSLPHVGETTPLLSKTIGRGPVTSTRQIRTIVQKCFDATVERMRSHGFVDEVEQLRAATVHWLRHTGISDDVKHRPREHVRDDAGHGSSAITDQYVDVELRARHASAKYKILNPFSEEKNLGSTEK